MLFFLHSLYRALSIKSCVLLLFSLGLQLSLANVPASVFWIEENLAKGSPVGQLSSTYGRDSMELRSIVYTSLAQDTVAQYFRVDSTDGTVYATEVIDREALCDDRVLEQSDSEVDYAYRRVRTTRQLVDDEKKKSNINSLKNTTVNNNSPERPVDQLRSQRAADLFNSANQPANTCRVKFQVHVGLILADDTSDSLLQDVHIMIADVNDNQPTFSSDVYLLQVLESSPVDAEFRLPVARDPDSGMHGVTVYKIDRIHTSHESVAGVNPLCHVTSTTEDKLIPGGNLRHAKVVEYAFAGDYFVLHVQRYSNGRLQPQLKQIRQLDREFTANLYLCLIAQDGGGNHGGLMVRIELLDANDNVPQWRGLPYKVHLSECDSNMDYTGGGGSLDTHLMNTYLTPTNTADSALRHLITLYADDPDLGVNGRCTFRLGQQASSGQMQSSIQKSLPNVIIKYNKVFIASKLDHETLPHFFIPVEVIDGGGLVNYTEIDVRVEDCNDHSPVITVIPLKPYSKLQQNQSQSSPTSNSIHGVIGSTFPADPILWLEEEYSARVDLATIMAQDRDKMDAGRVTCRLEHHKLAPSQAAYFDLVPLDGRNVGVPTPGLGTIKQAVSMFTLYKREGMKVDREKTASILISVLCTDNGSNQGHETRKLIYIHIMDINDNPPKITPSDYMHHDRSSPYITQTLSVPENQPFGTLIGVIRATDPDEGQNAQLTYHLLQPPYPANWTIMSDMPMGNVISELFELEHTTGKLFTNVPLDRETNASYVAYVKVSDRGEPSLTSIVRLHILVSDVNDNPPRFVVTEGAHGRIVFHTVESDGERPVHGRLVGQLAANDEDLGPNQTIQFSMVENSLSPSGLPVTYRITHEGNIYVDGLLDREQCAQHQLTVRAVDGGPLGHQLTASAVVIVQLDDLNDSPPQFVQPPTTTNSGIPSDLINITVKVPPGSVIYRVQATDMDQPANTKLHFVLRSAKFLSNYFTLRPTETSAGKSSSFSKAGADLILVNSLAELPAVQLTDQDATYATPKEYFIYIIVSDNDSEPSHSATARLRIHVYQDRPNLQHTTGIGSINGQINNNNNYNNDSNSNNYNTPTLGHVMGLTKLQHRSNADTSSLNAGGGYSTETETYIPYRYHKTTSITVILILAIVIICVFLGIFCFVAFLYLRGTQLRGSGSSPPECPVTPHKPSVLTTNGNGTGHVILNAPPSDSEDVKQMAYWELLNQNYIRTGCSETLHSENGSGELDPHKMSYLFSTSSSPSAAATVMAAATSTGAMTADSFTTLPMQLSTLSRIWDNQLTGALLLEPERALTNKDGRTDEVNAQWNITEACQLNNCSTSCNADPGTPRCTGPVYMGNVCYSSQCERIHPLEPCRTPLIKSCFKVNCPYHQHTPLTTFMSHRVNTTDTTHPVNDNPSHYARSPLLSQRPEASNDLDTDGPEENREVCPALRSWENEPSVGNDPNTTKSSDLLRASLAKQRATTSRTSKKGKELLKHEHNSNLDEELTTSNQGYCELIATDGRGSAPPTFIGGTVHFSRAPSDRAFSTKEEGQWKL